MRQIIDFRKGSFKNPPSPKPPLNCLKVTFKEGHLKKNNKIEEENLLVGNLQLPISTRLVAPVPERISFACGNIPAPGLGKSVCTRKFTPVGGASGDLQVIRELGCPKTLFFMKIVNKRDEHGAKRY